MLDKPRKEINQIDKEILKLLEKRYVCVDEVVRIKKENNIPTLDTSREKEVISNLSSMVTKEEYEESILETFQSIMDISKKYQNNKKED
ncbi:MULTISPECIES: chorismate mutase [Vagococcus]|uniref:chorismate mutase n=1 Tax=Vagococcus TaxID=2737 RepID=UPI002FCBA73A